MLHRHRNHHHHHHHHHLAEFAALGVTIYLVGYALLEKKLLPRVLWKPVSQFYFYPMMLPNLLVRLATRRPYFTEVGEGVSMGAVPMVIAGHVATLHADGVRAVVNMQAEYGGPAGLMLPCTRQLSSCGSRWLTTPNPLSSSWRKPSPLRATASLAACLHPLQGWARPQRSRSDGLADVGGGRRTHAGGGAESLVVHAQRTQHPLQARSDPRILSQARCYCSRPRVESVGAESALLRLRAYAASSFLCRAGACATCIEGSMYA